MIWKWSPTYEIPGMKLQWRFLSLFNGANWAFGIIRVDEKPQGGADE